MALARGGKSAPDQPDFRDQFDNAFVVAGALAVTPTKSEKK